MFCWDPEHAGIVSADKSAKQPLNLQTDVIALIKHIMKILEIKDKKTGIDESVIN